MEAELKYVTEVYKSTHWSKTVGCGGAFDMMFGETANPMMYKGRAPVFTDTKRFTWTIAGLTSIMVRH